jgi:hypothetical protein
MAGDGFAASTPTPEKTLRDLARNASKFLPDFAAKELAIGVK